MGEFTKVDKSEIEYLRRSIVHIDDIVSLKMRNTVVKMMDDGWINFSNRLATKGVVTFTTNPRYVKYWQEISVCLSKVMMD